MRTVLQPLAYLWAMPYTLLGLAIGLVGLVSGGSVQCRSGVLEFFGGGTRWFVRHLPLGEFTLALTLGHTILGQTSAALDVARTHEWVHVRQFERWGPLMGPAYLGCSLWLWLRGGRPYRDNPFEREAYDEAG
ncbi:MAG: hypothetical protein KDA63_00260 [Planctomycetales bacterium]|nr:hypothetical protein [Planctomycetales bacterium]